MSASPADPIDPFVVRGSVFADKYAVVREIGRGGMGSVVEAVHAELGTRVALKIMLPELAREERLVERFVREARAAARLSSEHVARVLDVGRHPAGFPYLVMELLEGEDLGKVVERGGLSTSDAALLLIQACEGLAHAHAAGIVHRDLKPENLFLTRRRDGAPCVKVLDFGIAKDVAAARAVTQTTDTFGSPHYMSPEQIRASRDVDARTDVWALGVVAFELLAGQPPFHADTVLELASMILKDPPLDLAALRPDLPPAVCAGVMRCLEKNRDARTANVAALAAVLAPFVPDGNAALARMSGVLGLASVPSVEPSGSALPPSSATSPPRNGGLGLAGTAPLATLSGAQLAYDAARTQPPASQRGLKAMAIVSLVAATAALVAVAVAVRTKSAPTTHAAPSASSPLVVTAAPTVAPIPSSAVGPATVPVAVASGSTPARATKPSVDAGAPGTKPHSSSRTLPAAPVASAVSAAKPTTPSASPSTPSTHLNRHGD